MTLTRQGFISAGPERKLTMPHGFAAMSAPYLRGLLDRFEAELPIREVTIYKGTSVGATTGVLENVIGYCLNTLDTPQADATAFAGINYEGEHQWSTKDSNPIEDPNAIVAWICSPEYAETQRRAHEAEMQRLAHEHLESLAALLRWPGPRPDLIVIDGIGYGKDDPLPPPFGSGA